TSRPVRLHEVLPAGNRPTARGNRPGPLHLQRDHRSARRSDIHRTHGSERYGVCVHPAAGGSVSETASVIADALKDALAQVRAATSVAELRDVRVRALGRKAPMSRVRSEMGSLTEEVRRETGR